MANPSSSSVALPGQGEPPRLVVLRREAESRIAVLEGKAHNARLFGLGAEFPGEVAAELETCAYVMKQLLAALRDQPQEPQDVGRCRWHGDGCRNWDCRDSGRWMDGSTPSHDPQEPSKCQNPRCETWGCANPACQSQPALPDIEAVSAEVHAAWMDSKRAQGVTTRRSESGEELMVPYAELSEAAKELDRGTVRAVYAAIQSTGGKP